MFDLKLHSCTVQSLKVRKVRSLKLEAELRLHNQRFTPITATPSKNELRRHLKDSILRRFTHRFLHCQQPECFISELFFNIVISVLK